MMKHTVYYALRPSHTGGPAFHGVLIPEAFADNEDDERVHNILYHISDGRKVSCGRMICRQFMGGKVKDLLSHGRVSPQIVSPRFVEVLTAAGVSNFRTTPVDLIDRKGHVVAQHYLLGVLGRCGPIRIEREEGDATVLEDVLRDYDGSDLFKPVETNFDLISSRLADVLRKAHLTNLALDKVILT